MCSAHVEPRIEELARYSHERIHGRDAAVCAVRYHDSAKGLRMRRSIFSGVMGAIVLLAGCVVEQEGHAQDRWDHGFDRRNYGYFGHNHFEQKRPNTYADASRFGDPNRYSVGYPRYYSSYYDSGLIRGGFSTGVYGYSSVPSYHGRRSFYSPYGSGIGVVPPTSPYYQPLGVHRHGDRLYAPIPGARAW
jgi:hypothetical protein